MYKGQFDENNHSRWLDLISQNVLPWTVLFFIMSILFTGCTSNNPPGLPSELPEMGIKSNQINTQFRLLAPAGGNTFKVEDTIFLVIDIMGKDQIAFESGYGTRIFTHSNGAWIELNNSVKYPDGPIILSPSNGDTLKMKGTGVSPILPDPSQAATIRVFLVGNVYRDGKITEEKTAAYIDVRLTP